MKSEDGSFSWWKWIAVGVAAIAAVWRFGLATEHLALGWLYFPLRVLPRVTVDVPAGVVGGLGLVGFVIGVHVTARWLVRATAPAASAAPPWSWRASMAASAIVLFLFAAGTAMVGATHQLVWLITGRMDRSTADSEPLLGALEAAREATRVAEERNDLKYLAIGVANYHDTYLTFPPGGTQAATGELMHGWVSYAMPFMFSAPDLDFAVPWNKSPNARYFQCNLRLFTNPSIPGPYFDRDGFGLAHIAGNIHVFPIRQIAVESERDQLGSGASIQQLQHQAQLIGYAHVTDGTANTIMFGTVAQEFKPWGHPANVRDPSSGVGRSPAGFGGPPAWGGAQFVMCDGSVRFMSNKTDPRVLAQLATPAGGEGTQVQQAPVGR